MLFLFRDLSVQWKERLTTRPKSVPMYGYNNERKPGLSSHPIIIIIIAQRIQALKSPSVPSFFQFSSGIKRRLLHNNLMKSGVFLFIALCHWHTTQNQIKQIRRCFVLSCLNPEEC
jgi:hypothetical protein